MMQDFFYDESWNVLVDGIHGMVFGKLGEIPATYPQSKKLDGGFIFLLFSALPGEDSHFD